MKICLIIAIYIIHAIIFCTQIFSSACAQSHLNWWTRLSITKPIAPTYHAELEGQFRLQNNYFTNHRYNPTAAHLTHSIRLFIHYRPSSEFSASISPFTWFAASPVISAPGDADLSLQHELRPSALVEWQPVFTPGLSAAVRTWIEYRDFQGTPNNLVRFRQRLGLRYRLADKWQAFLADEILLHMHGVANNQRYDHNRLIFNINYKPNPQWRIELGYMYANRLLRNRMQYINESNLITHFYYTFPQKN
jgi:hypothetical protein